MQSLVATLEHLLAGVVGDPGVEITRTHLVEAYIAIHKGVTRDDLLVHFEQVEPELANLRIVGRWHVRYSVARSAFHCERVPEAGHLDRLCEIANVAAHDELRRRLGTMDGYLFERVIAEIMRSAPWVARVIATQPRRDGGIDFELETKDGGLGPMRALGQAKRWTSKVPVSAMREFIGVLQIAEPRPHLGFFLATSGYTQEARAAAQRSPLKLQLFDLEHVLQWQLAGRVGVRVTELSVVSIDERFWSEVR